MIRCKIIQFITVSLLLFGMLCTSCKNDDSKGDHNTDTDSNTIGDEADFSCVYINPYSHDPECKEYYGNWVEADAKADCDQIFTNLAGTLKAQACDTAGAVGSCRVVEGDIQYAITWYYSQAELAKSYCESYYHGTWTDGESGSDAGVPDACQELADEAFQFMMSDDNVTVEPECANVACVNALETEKKWIEFSPAGKSPESAFVFYPGASVEPHLYAGIIQQIARAGYLTVIVPMPGKNALSGYDRITQIKAAHTDIKNWYLGGHSMGGIGAINFIKESQDEVDGLILWASYGTVEFDIHDASLPITSIYGEYDGQATAQKIEENKPYIPSTTLYTMIPGGNHAQFGHLCQNENDNDPKITRENQHELVSAVTIQFMNGVLAGGTNINTAYVDAEARAKSWCQTAQRLVVNVQEEILPESTIENNTTINVNDFGGTNALLQPQKEKKITVQTMFVYEGNGSSLLAPPIFVGEVWCKMKSQDSVATALKLTPDGPGGTCATINETAFNWALESVSEEERTAYQNSGKELHFLPDSEAETGPDLLANSEIEFAASKTSPAIHELRSPHLMVADEQSIPEEKRHVMYCKLWSPARALLWILEQR